MTLAQKQALQSLLEGLAKDTWERLEDANRLAVRLGEETITDILMLDIKREGLPVIKLCQHTKKREAISGADFEFLIGNNQGGWIRYAIQSKKLYQRNEKYHSLIGYKNRTQTQSLKNYASKYGAKPRYCLYNFSANATAASHWHCCLYPYAKEQLGCTITETSVIENVPNHFGAIHSQAETKPWRCLAICPKIRNAASNADRRPFYLPRLPLSVERHIEGASAQSRPADISSFPELFVDNVQEPYSEDVNFPKWITVLEVPEPEG